MFRVLCSGYERERERERERGGGREREIKKKHNQLYWFLPQFGSSQVPLALPRRFSLLSHKITTAKAHKQKTSNTQAHKQEILYAQAQKQKTS